MAHVYSPVVFLLLLASGCPRVQRPLFILQYLYFFWSKVAMFLHAYFFEKLYESSVNLIGVHSIRWKPHLHVFQTSSSLPSASEEMGEGQCLDAFPFYWETVWDKPLPSLEAFVYTNTAVMHSLKSSWGNNKRVYSHTLASSLDQLLLAVPWIWSWLTSCVFILALYATQRDWEFSNPGNCLFFVSQFCL